MFPRGSKRNIENKRVKMSMLPVAFSARNSGFFSYIEFMLKCSRISLCLLFPLIDLRILLQLIYEFFLVTLRIFTDKLQL